MAAVILQVVTVDEDIVAVYCNKDIKVRSENIIDEVLETCCGIG
jgi:translation initiation factor IF-2